MTGFPNSPRLIKGGIVVVDPVSGAVQRIIALQYNPDSLSRTLQVQGVGQEGGDRSEALRLKGPPTETLKVEAEIDATDQLEFPGKFPKAQSLGLHPVLSTLELLVYPTSQQLIRNDALAALGTLEIAPAIAPLTLFIWSQQRIMPVRITEFSITEEAFDAALNPIRAKLSLGLRVLNVNDLGFSSKGGSLFLRYLMNKELLAAGFNNAEFGALGIRGI